jgi:adenylate cyclase
MIGARWLRLLAAPLLAGLWGAALGAAHLQGQAPILDRVEAALTDLRTLARGETRPPDLVTIVAIDDALVDREKAYPLPRATLARIVEKIDALGPRAIALDLLLVEAGPDDGDRLLAEALAKRPAVIAAAAIFTTSGRAEADAEGLLARVPVADQFLSPMPIFAEAAQTGVVNVATDQDGVPRSAPLLFRTADRIEESLPLRVAAAATGSDPLIEPGVVMVGGKSIHTDLGQNLPLAFYGPRGTIRTLSAGDVLNGRIEPQSVEGRIVVIGTTVTAGGDVFPTPFDPVLPGVEVVSTAISNLMAGDGPVRNYNVRLVDAAMAILLPAALVGLLAWRRNVVGFAAIAGVLIAWAIINMLAFEHGIWMSAALPLAAAAPPAILFGAGQIWFQRRQAYHFARQATLLQRVQAPGMAHLLAQDPEFLKEPVRQHAAVVFVDLSGFTGLSESLGAAATRELLDAFYDRVDVEATTSGGAITSFTGDGAMILFGLPVPEAGDAAAAARCAIGLCRSMRSWLGSLPASIAPRIGFKIGAHYGIVVVSRLGHGRTQQIAATGDTVNVASRLMEVAARSGTELAVSDDLLQAAGRAAFEPGGLAGPFETRLRGRAHPLAVWTTSNIPAEAAGPVAGEGNSAIRQ